MRGLTRLLSGCVRTLPAAEPLLTLAHAECASVSAAPWATLPRSFRAQPHEHSSAQHMSGWRCIKHSMARHRMFCAARQGHRPPSDVAVFEVVDSSQLQPLLMRSNEAPLLLVCSSRRVAAAAALMSRLQSLARDSDAPITLAHLDVDNPGLAQLMAQLNVSSVPTIYTIFGGRVLDVKAGVPPDAELKSWFDRLTKLTRVHPEPLPVEDQDQDQPTASHDDLLNQGYGMLSQKGVKASDVAPLFGKVVAADSGANGAQRARAMAGLARCALLEDPPNIAAATQCISQAKEAVGGSGTAAEVAVAEIMCHAADELARLQSNADASTGDEASKSYTSVLQLFVDGDVEAAVGAALRHIAAHRGTESEGLAKALLLRVFDALGSAHPLTKSGRRRLSNLVFA